MSLVKNSNSETLKFRLNQRCNMNISTMQIKYPLLLDGGLSNVLESQGCDLNQELWSAKMLVDQPEAIIKAHLMYLESSAQCDRISIK